jgi:hypothetical protein
MESYGIVIATGIVAGIINRWLLLRSDYRHYPTYPHGQLIHLALGFIAASLGAVAVPAIAKPDYVAVTFLVLAAQQFREVRNMERETLMKLEESKIISRGTAYIEGIARVFEARNYLVIMTALATSAAVQLGGLKYAFLVAPIIIIITLKLMGGSFIGDIAQFGLHFHLPGKYIIIFAEPYTTCINDNKLSSRPFRKIINSIPGNPGYILYYSLAAAYQAIKKRRLPYIGPAHNSYYRFGHMLTSLPFYL